MNISLTFKNFEPSDHLRKYAQKRFEKLIKYANTGNTELKINLGVEKFRHIAEVTLSGDNMNMSAVEESEDMYSSIDLVYDKMTSQVRKLREKGKDRRRSRGTVRDEVISFEEGEAGREATIVEAQTYKPKPMLVDEAAMQLDTLNYEFLVFLNAETERVNVIYRRKTGDYGLIDPGMYE
ncbi:putative sigma-54 modulation protein [Desulfobaculum xiamenense]|uniref:Ribosome hibernation promoting factor n=1 Tax=Desulfobaculum xiamenense TaxID=995050 RepID=A0A846QNA4_9BACT|nr:ribosome-associated translation inhibitor RaiA [Desulfobaculum xiamenense]NJB66714.1 putative sigma-54 modulation protein [Desulfobaculum xiamenense]